MHILMHTHYAIMPSHTHSGQLKLILPPPPNSTKPVHRTTGVCPVIHVAVSGDHTAAGASRLQCPILFSTCMCEYAHSTGQGMPPRLLRPLPLVYELYDAAMLAAHIHTYTLFTLKQLPTIETDIFLE